MSEEERNPGGDLNKAKEAEGIQGASEGSGQ